MDLNVLPEIATFSLMCHAVDKTTRNSDALKFDGSGVAAYQRGPSHLSGFGQSSLLWQPFFGGMPQPRPVSFDQL